MPVRNEIINQLLKDSHSPEDLPGESALLKQLTRKPAERALIVIFDFAPGIRKAIHTTSTIALPNGSPRRVTKTCRVFSAQTRRTLQEAESAYHQSSLSTDANTGLPVDTGL